MNTTLEKKIGSDFSLQLYEGILHCMLTFPYLLGKKCKRQCAKTIKWPVRCLDANKKQHCFLFFCYNNVASLLLHFFALVQRYKYIYALDFPSTVSVVMLLLAYANRISLV